MALTAKRERLQWYETSAFPHQAYEGILAYTHKLSGVFGPVTGPFHAPEMWKKCEAVLTYLMGPVCTFGWERPASLQTSMCQSYVITKAMKTLYGPQATNPSYKDQRGQAVQFLSPALSCLSARATKGSIDRYHIEALNRGWDQWMEKGMKAPRHDDQDVTRLPQLVRLLKYDPEVTAGASFLELSKYLYIITHNDGMKHFGYPDEAMQGHLGTCLSWLRTRLPADAQKHCEGSSMIITTAIYVIFGPKETGGGEQIVAPVPADWEARFEERYAQACKFFSALDACMQLISDNEPLPMFHVEALCLHWKEWTRVHLDYLPKEMYDPVDPHRVREKTLEYDL